jgi:hypothetical protein
VEKNAGVTFTDGLDLKNFRILMEFFCVGEREEEEGVRFEGFSLKQPFLISLKIFHMEIKILHGIFNEYLERLRI